MRSLALLVLSFISISVTAQVEVWPKTIEAEKGSVVIYQPQPEELVDNHLKARAAVSVKLKSAKDPVFGAIWFDALVETDRVNRVVTLSSLEIPNMRFPGDPEEDKLDELRKVIIEDSKSWDLNISLDQLLATLDYVEKEQLLASDLNDSPPIIIYTTTPSVLVYFDGEPIFQKLEDSELKRAVNTPYLILLNPDDKKFYLSGGDLWFASGDVLSGWSNVSSPPSKVKKAAKNLVGGDSVNVTDQSTIPEIVIATKPTELVQTTGDPSYQNITGTNLLYVSNSDNHIFMDINTQLHYMLISGRWFTSKTIGGPWTYLKATSLPEDFKKIPEGSEKDIVLASVPGTKAAEEAVLDAQIPQTATVDRKTASTNVEYDGDPIFEKIEGTDMLYAKNTSATVIKSGSKYYAIENAVWFESNSPTGPWVVATSRPSEVDEIPATSPVYNVKYVYIYDSTPDVVYVGYTSGYTGSYIYGPTIVYGTGYHYSPWYGRYYYPRPVTYGFNMHYNPYSGWSFGFGYSYNYYYPHYHYRYPYYSSWYGPPYYHPSRPVRYNNGYYGPRSGSGSNSGSSGGSRTYNPDSNTGSRSSNLYNNHQKGVTTPQRPSTGSKTKNVGTDNKKVNQSKKAPKNNVYSDKQGNVYKEKNNSWQSRDSQNNKWVDPNSKSSSKNNYNNNKGSLNQSKSDRNRGYQNYNKSQSRPSYGGSSRPSSGASRPSGGGVKRRN